MQDNQQWDEYDLNIETDASLKKFKVTYHPIWKIPYLSISMLHHKKRGRGGGRENYQLFQYKHTDFILNKLSKAKLFKL